MFGKNQIVSKKPYEAFAVAAHRIPIEGWSMKQRGYFDLNVTGFIVGCLIVGAAIGIAIAYLVPWLWSFIKPLIHTITA